MHITIDFMKTDSGASVYFNTIFKGIEIIEKQIESLEQKAINIM